MVQASSQAIRALWKEPLRSFSNCPRVRTASGSTKAMLQPGGSEKVSAPWPAPPQNMTVPVRAVVDPNEQVGDCHLDNNTASSTPVKCSPIG